jgi:hypothetical protein
VTEFIARTLLLFILAISISIPVQVLLIIFKLFRARKNWLILKIATINLIFSLWILATFMLIPGFTKISAIAYQTNAKIDLGAIYTMQMKYFQDHGRFSGGDKALSRIGFNSYERNRYLQIEYSYICGGEVVHPEHRDEFVEKMFEREWDFYIKPEVTDTAFTCIAIGNLEHRGHIDVWSFNSDKVLSNHAIDYPADRDIDFRYKLKTSWRTWPIATNSYYVDDGQYFYMIIPGVFLFIGIYFQTRAMRRN